MVPATRPILLVDDEPDDEFLVRHRLTKSGVSQPILSFSDGADLISYLERARSLGAEISGLLFLDLKMPRVDGFDALTWIRAQTSLNELNVVVVTSSSRPEDVERAYACGAQRVLTKFPTADVLKTAVSAFG